MRNHPSANQIGSSPSLFEMQRAPELHRLQEALVAEQAVQYGYCYNGQIIKGAELLFKNPEPIEAQIR